MRIFRNAESEYRMTLQKWWHKQEAKKEELIKKIKFWESIYMEIKLSIHCSLQLQTCVTVGQFQHTLYRN